MFDRFIKGLAGKRVLELGVACGVNHRDMVTIAGGEWIGTDIAPGPLVSFLGDAHELSSFIPESHFDAAIITSTLEHLCRPWVVAQELAKVVKPGGSVFCATHQSFPVHNYPSDYFRFSTDALRVVFCSPWEVVQCEYEHPAKVVPLENNFPHGRDWNFEAPAWIGVRCVARRLRC